MLVGFGYREAVEDRIPGGFIITFKIDEDSIRGTPSRANTARKVVTPVMLPLLMESNST